MKAMSRQRGVQNVVHQNLNLEKLKIEVKKWLKLKKLDKSSDVKFVEMLLKLKRLAVESSSAAASP